MALGTSPAAAAPNSDPDLVGVGDTSITLEFDDQLRSRVALQGLDLTRFDAGEALLVGGKTIEAFAYRGHTTRNTRHPRHGAGVRVTIEGTSKEGVQKTVVLTSFERLTGMIVMKVTYTNRSSTALKVTGWRNGAHELLEAPGGFYTFSGTTYTDRRDWVMPVEDGYAQENSLGMDSSDYGGGTPLATVWRRDAGLSVGHVEPVATVLRMPVRRTGAGASIAIQDDTARTLKPGRRLSTDTTFLTALPGDHFVPLQRYRDYMSDIGQRAPKAPASAFEPIWCAWGYERGFATEQVTGALPKAHEIGLRWAALDDGWQTNEGDWDINTAKFPRGEADMRAFTKKIRDAGLRPRLWWAPLAADPDSNLFRDRPDMLLLDRDGNKQDVTWWDAYTLSGLPADGGLLRRAGEEVHRRLGLRGAQDRRPAPQQRRALLQPEAPPRPPRGIRRGRGPVLEGDPRSRARGEPRRPRRALPLRHRIRFPQPALRRPVPQLGPGVLLPGPEQGQVDEGADGRGQQLRRRPRRTERRRRRLRVLLRGRSRPVDQVHPPRNRSPGQGDRPHPGEEVLWRKWVSLYEKNMLSTGEYRGELYDIGFDKPEAHVVAKKRTLHYAFYADQWDGTVELRGLGRTRYRLTDPFTGKSLGTATAQHNTVNLSFERFQLIVAEPIG